MSPGISGLMAGKLSSTLSLSCWKSDHVEEEEKEFSNLNEGEERKAETGQDEGKTETQKNRMKGRSDAKTGDNKGQGDWRTPFPQP